MICIISFCGQYLLSIHEIIGNTCPVHWGQRTRCSLFWKSRRGMWRHSELRLILCSEEICTAMGFFSPTDLNYLNLYLKKKLIFKYIILLSSYCSETSAKQIQGLHKKQMPESTEEVKAMSSTLRLWLTGEYRGPARCRVSWALGHRAKPTWQLTGKAT